MLATFFPPQVFFFHDQCGIWKFLGLGVESELQLLALAIATGICHIYSNAGSEPHLQPMPQLAVMPDH